MNDKQLPGVCGLLDQLLSLQSTAPDSLGPPAHVQSSTSMPQLGLPAAVVPSPPAASRLAARRGRPPGKGKLSEAGPKEKVTLWVAAALIAEYRDWSWEARTQLSRLVERALLHFREQHRSTRSAA